MRFFIILILFCIVPLVVSAQELYPTDALPTQALDQKNVLKDEEYQLELSPLEESNATDEGSLMDSLSSDEREKFNARGYIIRPILFSDETNSPRESYEGGMIFSLSNARLDVGAIAGEVKKTDEVILTVSAGGLYGYTMLGIQETPFESARNSTIPPIHCTGTKELCGNALGWGYTISDIIRPFKVQEQTQLDAKNFIKGLRSTPMEFHLRTPPQTPEGNYETTIRLVVLPKL